MSGAASQAVALSMGRPPVYPFRWGIAVAALVSLVGCAQPNDQERSSMSEATQGSTRVETRPVYFGRFAIDVPTNMTLEAERYVVGSVIIENIAAPVPKPAYDSLWRDRVARIGAEVNEDTKRRAEIVENVDLAPGARAVFYHG